jgi:hypothetical protein
MPIADNTSCPADVWYYTREFQHVLVLSYTMHDENSLVRDLVSGAIMAATSVPQLIAYAETTGFSGYRGLTTAGPPYVYTKNCTTTTSSCRRVSDHGGKLKTFVRSYIAALSGVYVYIGFIGLAWRRGVW